MLDQVFQMSEARAKAPMKSRAHLLQNPYLSAPLTQETNGESDCQRYIDESRPVIGDFAQDDPDDRSH